MGRKHPKSPNFEDKLIDLTAQACEKDGISTIYTIADVLTSLMVFAYIKLNMRGYEDFSEKMDNICKAIKNTCLDKYAVALEKEL